MNYKSPTVTEIDGLLIDTETGEILDSELKALVGDNAPFDVTDQDSLEWAMRKMMDADAELAKQEAILKALSDNQKAIVKRAESRAEWLKLRFGPSIEQFCKNNLSKGKKSYSTPYGTVKFTASKGKFSVLDESAALSALYKHKLGDAIKVKESVLISEINDDDRKMLAESHPDAFSLSEPCDKMNIVTGVGK
jgi:hypothetical protein